MGYEHKPVCQCAADVVKGSKRQAQRVWELGGRHKREGGREGEKEARRLSRFLPVIITYLYCKRGNAANVGRYLSCLAKVTGGY